MGEFEQLLGLFVAAVILAGIARRVGAPYPVFLALGGAADRVSSRGTVGHPSARVGAGAVYRTGAARRRLRRITERSEGQLGARHRPGRLCGWTHHWRSCHRRSRLCTDNAMGSGDCARCGGRSARRRRRDGRAPPAAAAASPPHDSRRRKPAERRDGTPDLPAGSRRGRGERFLHCGRGAGIPARGGRQPDRRSGARVGHLACARSCARTCRPRSFFSSSPPSAYGSSRNVSICRRC